MKKYDDYNSFVNEGSKIESLINKDETVIWRGKPKKNAYILNQVLGMLPFALLWLLFDGAFIAFFFIGNVWEELGTGGTIGIIIFFALHLIPVWVWFARLFTSNRKWKLTEYAITDKRVIIKGGFFGSSYKSIMYTEITNVQFHVGLIDRLTHVGDIIINTSSGPSYENGSTYVNGRNISIPAESIIDIENPHEIYMLLEKTVRDIQTDIMYPNALRPNENKGYKTKYKKDN